MKSINRIGRMFLIAALVCLPVIPVQAQVNSNVLSVNLQYSLSESITLSIVSGGTQVFPTSVGGPAATPLVINTSWVFAQARHLTVTPYFTDSTKALVGTSSGYDINTNLQLAVQSNNGLADGTYWCNHSPSDFAGSVFQAGATPGNICVPIYDQAGVAAGPGNVNSTVTVTLTPPNPNTWTVDSYTGTLFVSASAL
jgi:hypothetical protein